MTDISFRKVQDKENGRFEFYDGETLAAGCDYRASKKPGEDGAVEIRRVKVDEAYGGRGVAGQLMTFALDTLEQEGVTAIRPVCDYANHWMGKNPGYGGFSVLEVTPEDKEDKADN